MSLSGKHFGLFWILRLVASVLAAGFALPLDAQVAQIAHFVAPIYPPLARQAMIAGQVALKVTLSAEGDVAGITEESSAHPLLVQHAKASVSEWKFQAGSSGLKVSVILYYGFSGTTHEVNPNTVVKADFNASTIRVFITTDPATTVRP
jgi:TonB family protein